MSLPCGCHAVGDTALLVVAKAPEPGRAKTRLTPPATGGQAADIAAASLLDTLRAAVSAADAVPVVALTGTLAAARRREELLAALHHVMQFRQRGDGLADRLAAAHADTGAALPGRPVLQIGMDTPQVTGDLLAGCAQSLHGRDAPDALLGPASDGGWWALGLRDPRHAALLRSVPMSSPDTGELTARALRSAGLRVEMLCELADVDTMVDARDVAQQLPGSEFAAAVAAVASASVAR